MNNPDFLEMAANNFSTRSTVTDLLDGSLPLWNTSSVPTLLSAANGTGGLAIPDGCVLPPFLGFIPWDNPDNLVSQEVEGAVEKAVNLVALTLLFIVGTPANVINMIVFYRHGLRERINLCLFCQSLADLVYMLHSFFMHADRLYLDSGRFGVFMRFQFKSKLIALAGCAWVSGFISAVVASERCFCVVSPFKSKTVLKTSTMGVILLVAHVLILGGYFFLTTRYEMVCVFNPVTRTTSSDLLPNQFFFDHQQLFETLEVVVYGFILPGFCVTTIFLATVIIVVKLKRMAAWRKQASTSSAMSGRDLALTKMLVATSILFLVAISPALVLRMAIVLEPELSLAGRYYNLFYLLLSLSQLLSYVNSSVNAIFYYNIGSRYRETARELFSVCCKTKLNRNNRTPEAETSATGV